MFPCELCSHWLCNGQGSLTVCYGGEGVTLVSQEVVRSKSAEVANPSACGASTASCPSQEHLKRKPTEGIYKRRLTRAGGLWMVWGAAKEMVSVAQKD